MRTRIESDVTNLTLPMSPGGMEDKFRQIQRFVELLQHLSADAHLPGLPGLPSPRPARSETVAPSTSSGKDPVQPAGASLSLVDMGCGKGYRLGPFCYPDLC